MCEIIRNPIRMSIKEMSEEFDGKWVFAIDTDGTKTESSKTAIPVIIADTKWENKELGIFEDFLDNCDSYLTISFLKDEMSSLGYQGV